METRHERVARENGHDRMSDHCGYPLTAADIAAEAGIDDFLVEAKLEHILELVCEYQIGGRLVAITIDGAKNVHAPEQSDVVAAVGGTHPNSA
jgi:high-affinity K+ transport system ATPase subunit B